MNSPLLDWVLQCYGHCLPRNSQATGPEFSALIRQSYDTRPVRNAIAAKFAAQCPGIFRNTGPVLKYEE